MLGIGGAIAANAKHNEKIRPTSCFFIPVHLLAAAVDNIVIGLDKSAYKGGQGKPGVLPGTGKSGRDAHESIENADGAVDFFVGNDERRHEFDHAPIAGGQND